MNSLKNSKQEWYVMYNSYPSNTLL